VKNHHQIGDLVHIPQAVDLIDCDIVQEHQLTIPLKVESTSRPVLGVVTCVSQGGYVRVYCNGNHWSVKDNSVYKI